MKVVERSSSCFRFQIAADWLVAHVHDPHLDESEARTFVLYLCPSCGTPLQKQLQTFWDASNTQIGFNSAHNSFPHITLFSGMSVADTDVETLLRSVKARRLLLNGLCSCSHRQLV